MPVRATVCDFLLGATIIFPKENINRNENMRIGSTGRVRVGSTTGADSNPIILFRRPSQ